MGRRRQPIPPLSGWARAYLALVGLRHALVGGTLFLYPSSYTGASFEVIRSILPLRVWGVLFLLVGVHALGVVVNRHELWARVVIVFSVAITAAWAASFVYAAFVHQLSAPTGPIIWTVLMAKDMVVATRPLRPSPFQPIIEELRAEGRIGDR